MDFSFKKSERLKSQKLIGSLFRKGKSVGSFPLRAVFLPLLIENAEKPVQVSISVPKRNFKKSVERNRIRRQIREAWRLEKNNFYEKLGENKLALMIIFTGKEAVDFAEIQKSVGKMCRKLLETLHQADSNPTEQP